MANEIDPGTWASLKEDEPTSDTSFEAQVKIYQEAGSFHASAFVRVQFCAKRLREWFANKRYRFGKLLKALFDSTGE